MNAVINFALKNKFAVGLLTIIIIVAGLYSGLNMKLETIPDINTPLITISATDPGATPAEVNDQVTTPIEQAVRNLDGVQEVDSTSRQNISSIQIQYSFGKDMDKALNEVNQAVDGISLPDGVNTPSVSQLSFNSIPVITLSATHSHESISKLTDQVNRNIVPALKGLEGVASVDVSGQEQKQVQINFKPKQLAKYGLDQSTVEQLIKGAAIDTPLGMYTLSGEEKSVVVNGNVKTLKQLKQLPIPVTPSQNQTGSSYSGAGATGPTSSQAGQKSMGQGGAASLSQYPSSQGSTPSTQGTTSGVAQGLTGQTQNNAAASQMAPSKLKTIQLQDIATIQLKTSVESISKTNGKNSISLQVVKAADANTVDVVDAVKKEVKQLEKDNPGLHFINSYDQGQPIKDSVHTMLSKALFGAIFAMLIIMLFLRNIRTTLIAVVSIPMSILIAILILKQMNITLNLMTLGALTVAIGRVVDDSIVVIENIYRRMTDKGENLRGMTLIREATKEMFRPICSSTIVTIAVFLPMGLVRGMVGQLFLPFALSIVFALLSSLLVAVTIVPAMAHSLLRKTAQDDRKRREGPNKLSLFYRTVLNWVLNHKWITSIIAVLLLVGSFALVPSIGFSFLSSQQDNSVIATYKPDPGQTLSDVKKVAQKAQDYLQTRKGVKTIEYSLGGGNPMDPTATNQALFFVQYKSDFKNIDTEKNTVIKALKAQGGKGTWQLQDFSATGSTNQIQVEVYGNSMNQIKPVVAKVEKKMKQQSDLDNVESGLSQTYQEYTFVANQKKLNQYGLTAGQIAMALNPNQSTQALTTVQINGEDVDVQVKAPTKSFKGIKDLENEKLVSPLGMTVKIGDVAQVKKGTTADTITHQNGQPYVDVTAKAKTKNVGKASQTLKQSIDNMKLPSGVNITMGGVTKDMQQSFTQLGLAMLAAIAIVYFILVVTFGGGLAPLAILFSLPFTVIGGLVGLWISGETLSVSAMIGALMLIGIVVTNAIVLVDRVIHKEQEGLSTREALLEAGMTRIRPILMTAIATIGALLPLALGYEGSAFISKSLGVTVIGGLTSSTLLTLLIVPIVYESLSRFNRKKKTA